MRPQPCVAAASRGRRRPPPGRPESASDSKYSNKVVPGPPKEPKIMALYPKIESISSIGSMILAVLEIQVKGPMSHSS